MLLQAVQRESSGVVRVKVALRALQRIAGPDRYGGLAQAGGSMLGLAVDRESGFVLRLEIAVWAWVRSLWFGRRECFQLLILDG